MAAWPARARTRSAAPLLAVAGLLLAGQATAAPPALAHSALEGTGPAEGSRVSSSPSEVSLQFNEPVSTRFGRVEVTGPDGTSRWHDGEPQVSGSVVTQPVGALGPAGPYRVAWRVISADGHPISGAYSFTLTEPGTGTPVGSESAAGSRDGRGAVATGVVAAVLLLAAGVAVRRRRGGLPVHGA